MNVAEYLEQLGGSSAEVAQALRQQGVKGLKGSHCHCPILNAIYQAIPHYWTGLHILGGGTSNGTKVHYHATLHDGQIMNPTLPPAVQDFLADFDAGLYPDLIAQKVVETSVRTWE